MKALTQKQKKVVNDISFMRTVAKDLYAASTKKGMTYAEAIKCFYQVMRQHGIKQGEWDENGVGRVCNNFEWTMCYTMFLDCFHSHNSMLVSILGKVPKDLLAYGKRPKRKLQ